MIRLIVSDMDDTLLTPKGDVSPRTLAALQAAIEAGALVTFASGRMVESATGWAHQLGVNAPLILYNGGLVYDLETKKTISRMRFSGTRPMAYMTVEAAAPCPPAVARSEIEFLL